MKRWDIPLTALIYALALFPLLLLSQLAWLLPGWLPLPSLLPLAVGTVAVLEGPEFGAGYGLYLGVFACLQQPDFSGPAIFLFSLLGFLCGAFRRHVPGGFSGCLVMGLLCLFATNLLRSLWWGIAEGAAAASVLGLSGAELLISLAFFPLVYLLYRFCRKKTRHLSVFQEEEA